MSFTGDIYDHLSGESTLTDLVGARIYPTFNTSATETRPQIVYTTISQERHPHLTGTDPIVRSVVQFDADAATGRSAEAVADALRRVLDRSGPATWGTTAVRDVYIDQRRNDFEPPADADGYPTFRVSMDFVIWHVESAPIYA